MFAKDNGAGKMFICSDHLPTIEKLSGHNAIIFGLIIIIMALESFIGVEQAQFEQWTQTGCRRYYLAITFRDCAKLLLVTLFSKLLSVPFDF